MTLEIPVLRLSRHAILPTKSHDHDAGWDLYALESTTLRGPSNKVRTGIALAIPPGYFGLVRDRSGNAVAGLRVAAGVIDSGYRGEVLVILDSLVPAAYPIRPGDRLAQLILLPLPQTSLVEVTELPPAEDGRGEAGLGSSGR